MERATSFEEFLKEFEPKVASKEKQLTKMSWILETTGSQDAADLLVSLSLEYKELFSDEKLYQKLLEWKKQEATLSPLLKRELHELIKGFKVNMIPHELFEEIATKEADLSQTYATFRPKLDGKELLENDIVEAFKKEKVFEKRKKIWETSKQIGDLLAPKILKLVALRNQEAKFLGYSDYFQMQLDLQEVDGKWLSKTFEELSLDSQKAYDELIHEIETVQMKEFSVSKEFLGPWAWKDPFGQEDPLGDTKLFDRWLEGKDLVSLTKEFYQKMGMDTSSIFARSDLFEREKKNQHAFCLSIDRKEDVRVLTNARPVLRWMDTLLHELGHAVYELGFDEKLPWLLRKPPHMLTTEAMALLAGRQAFSPNFLKDFLNVKNEKDLLQAKESLKRRELVLSRWILVMTDFERELYRNPSQDLNGLWWKLVEKHQKIKAPKGREGHADWAAKYHIGLAPVYYFSYLLGEIFASMLLETLKKETGKEILWTPEVGSFLQKRLFSPGDRFRWDLLIEKVAGEPLTARAWVQEFAR